MRTVVIVDDDRAIRELLKCALEYEDYAVMSLNDGSRVIATLEAANEPCIVLMDLMMPLMDGWAVCRALADRPDLLARHALVLMSAGSPRDNMIPREARAFISKPFDLYALYRLLASFSSTLLAAPIPMACAALAS